MWFYDFLDAHLRLMNLQIKFNDLMLVMSKSGSLKRVTRSSRVFYEVTKRHIKENEISDMSSRILNIRQNDIMRICSPVVEGFLWAIERDNLLNELNRLSVLYNGKEYKYKKNCKRAKHFVDYALHGYDIVKKYYESSLHDMKFEKTISIVVAFDGVTDTLHHSDIICTQIAKYHPITGNVKKDADVINKIVKFDIMNGHPHEAMEHLIEYTD